MICCYIDRAAQVTLGQCATPLSQCLAGYWCTTDSLSIAANTCPPGQFAAAGQATCASCNCAAGYSCLIASVSSSGTACGIGQYGPGSTAPCTNCALGYYGASAALTAATCSGQCSAGYYCPAGSSNATANKCFGSRSTTAAWIRSVNASSSNVTLSMVSGTPLGTIVMSNTRTGMDVMCSDAPARLPSLLVSPNDGAGVIAAVAVADVNGDGAVDVVARLANGTVVAARNDGRFNFSTSPSVTLSRTASCSAVWDVNGDGLVDVVVWNVSGGAVGVWRSNGSLMSSSATYGFGIPGVGSGGATVVSVGVADLSGDGVLDIVIASTSSSGLWVGVTTSSGSFQDVTATQSPALFSSSASTCVVLGDVNSDGAVDVLMCKASSPPRLWLNNGAMMLSNWTDIGSQAVSSGCFGDVDNDGDVDLLLSGSDTRLYINDGTGLFTLWLTWSVSGVALLVDVNGDGRF